MDRRPRKPTERAREAAPPKKATKKAPPADATPPAPPTDEPEEETTPEYQEAPLAEEPAPPTPEYQEALPIVHAVPLTERVAHAVLAIPVGEITKNARAAHSGVPRNMFAPLTADALAAHDAAHDATLPTLPATALPPTVEEDTTESS